MAALIWRSASLSKRIFCQKPSCISNISRLYSNDVRQRLSIGTIGHIDHGKTTLTAAITKVLSQEGKAKFLKYDEIDRAPEEKARGITINACHVGYATAKRDYTHTDCPGHIDFIKNMIVGTSQMDGAVLVVAATDGLMPQTREHLMLAKQIGVENILVYINKADIVESDIIELVQLEISELLDEVGYDSEKIPFITGSALCTLKDTQPEIGHDSIMKLLEQMDGIPVPDRKTTGPFVMPIESAVSVSGRGTVVIGTVQEGTVTKPQDVIVQGFGSSFKGVISSIGMFDTTVDRAKAGDNVGLLVRGVRKEAVQRGMYISDPAAGVRECDAFKARIYVRSKAEGGRSQPIKNRYTQSIFVDTWNVPSCILLPDDVSFVMPGDSVVTDIILKEPMVIREGQKFIIREGVSTNISGMVLELLPPTDIIINGFNRDTRAHLKPTTENPKKKKKKAKS